ncbi:MAG: hypothetical protein GX287_02230 [Fusobacteria bacterium]|nr:hypothetical protein [Fusobacteriota bacterium]
MFNLLIAISIIVVYFLAYNLFKKKTIDITFKKNTEISGIIIGKYDDKPIENVVVMLGQIDKNNKKDNVFKKISNYELRTDKNGKFIFKNIDYSKYFVYAEYNGKKVLSYVKIDENTEIIDDLILII